MDDYSASLVARTAEVLAERLEEQLLGGWRVEPGGARLVGPRTLGVELAAHGEGPKLMHTDIGFALNRSRPDVPMLWDCAAGWGDDLEARVQRAVDMWSGSVLPVLRELLDARGTHAPHFSGHDAYGIPGWHVIHGPAVAFGPEDMAPLLAWAEQHPLPSLLPGLADALERPRLNGIKAVFGSVSEIRINGVRHDALSEALAAQPWPRPSWGFLRCYVLAVGPERAPA